MGARSGSLSVRRRRSMTRLPSTAAGAGPDPKVSGQAAPRRAAQTWPETTACLTATARRRGTQPTRPAHRLGTQPAGHRPARNAGSGHRLAGEAEAGSGHRPARDAGSGDRPAGDVRSGHRPAGDAGSGHRPAGDAGSGHGPAGDAGSGHRLA